MQAHEKSIPPQDLQAVVRFIKTLSPRFASETPPPCVEIPEPAPLTDQSLAEGRQVYRILQCWKCHGRSGRGDGPSAPGLKDDWGQPIKPYNFAVMKKFKCGNGDRDLYRTLHTGMNGSPMPSFEAAFLFAREDVADFGLFADFFGGREAKEVAEYIQRQPDAASLKALSEKGRAELIERHTWALIHYLRSLLSTSP